MLDLVGNREELFSHDVVQVCQAVLGENVNINGEISMPFSRKFFLFINVQLLELSRFQPVPAQTVQYSCSRSLEA